MENKGSKENDWRLDKIEIEFKSFGEHEGKYVGRIRFQNGEHESFIFKIKPDMAKPYIELIGSDIVKCAESLGARLVESLGLKNGKDGK